MFDYYTPPSQEVFDDIKQASIKVWQSMDDTYGYTTDKIKRIKDLENVQDNAWYMFAMFDIFNQAKLINLVASTTQEKIQEMLDWSKS